MIWKTITYLKIFFIFIVSISIANNSIQIYETDKSLHVITSTLSFEISQHPSGSIYLSKLSQRTGKGLLQEPGIHWPGWKICPLWQIGLSQPKVSFNSNFANFIEWRAEKEEHNVNVLLKWQYQYDSYTFYIMAKIRISNQDPSTLWNLTIQSLNAEEFSLKEVTYPIIGDFQKSSSEENIRLVAPYIWGHEYFKAENSNYRAIYPSAHAAMQFLSYYNDRTQDGILITALDTVGYQKLVANHQGTERFPYARAEITIFPRNFQRRSWAMPYSMKVETFSGNWYDAAKIYRKWVTKNARWCVPNLNKKKTWLWNNTFWIRGSLPSDTTFNFRNTPNLDYYSRINTSFNFPIAVHLYNWHHFPFDDMYPFYFPPRAGFKEFILNLSDDKIKVVPYINARLADMRIVTSDHEFKKNACLWENKTHPKIRPETYNKNAFAVMCPSTTFWQNRIYSIVKELKENYPVFGVYYDQVCNASAVKCVNPNHDHPPDPEDETNFSSGTHWVRGYRKMFQQINAKLIRDANFISISENNAESWNDLIDAHLMLEYRISDREKSYRVIPLYPSVYSGYTTTIGFGYYNPIEIKYKNVLAFKLARSFVWGSQIGWVKPEKLIDNPTFFSYIKNLSQIRYAIRNYINFGEILAEPRMKGKLDSVKIFEMVRGKGKEYHPIQFEHSPILTSFWKLNEDSSVVLITNYSKQELITTPIDLIVDLNRYGLSFGEYQLNHISTDGIKTEKVMLQHTKQHIKISLPSYSVKALEIIAVQN